MNFQITVLKVLAGHPDGRASLADLKHYVAVLANSGADWTQRMKRLSARAPGLDIFSSGYVIRDVSGWQITDAGQAFLTSIEAPAAQPTAELSKSLQHTSTGPDDPLENVIRIADRQQVHRRRAAANCTKMAPGGPRPAEAR